jgi:hypothetical protein
VATQAARAEQIALPGNELVVRQLQPRRLGEPPRDGRLPVVRLDRRDGPLQTISLP